MNNINNLSEPEVRDIFKTAFDATTADEVELSMDWYNETNRDFICGITRYIRFSRSHIRKNVHIQRYTPLRIRVGVRKSNGMAQGMSTTNQLDRGSIRAAMQRAEATARAATPAPNFRHVLGPQEYLSIPGFDPDTAALTNNDLVEIVAGPIARLQDAGMSGSAFFQVSDVLQAHGTNAGLWFYRRATQVGYMTTVRSDGTMGRESSRVGSGWAGIGDMRRMADVNINALNDAAMEKARRARNPQPFDMGRYTVVLEPVAAEGFIRNLLALIGGASTVDEWKAPARAGDRVASDLVTIRTDPAHPEILSSPYGGGGHPIGEVVWVRNGIVENVPGADAGRLPAARFLSMEGTDKTIDDLVSEVDRGILVSRANPGFRTLDPPYVNGITRDGVFWIENGRITRPLHNAWFSVRLDDIVNGIEALSRPYKTSSLGYTGWSGNLIPAMRVRGFNFHRPSDAV